MNRASMHGIASRRAGFGRESPGISIAESDTVMDVPPSSLFSVLLVEPDHVDRVLAHSTLASAGFIVAASNTYDDAHARLVANPPLVLVTSVRLGVHDGVLLALRAQSENPRTAIILTSSAPDPVRQRDADRIGATFVLKPIPPEDLLAAIYRTTLRQADAVAEPIRPPFERRRGERRVNQSVTVMEERRRAGRRRDIASVLLGGITTSI
jgi:CheY-like chemotaxis protein